MPSALAHLCLCLCSSTADANAADATQVDAALAALGLDKMADGAQQQTAEPSGSVLPWSRDREAERERERLKAALQKKIAGGDSHKKPDRKAKK